MFRPASVAVSLESVNRGLVSLACRHSAASDTGISTCATNTISNSGRSLIPPLTLGFEPTTVAVAPSLKMVCSISMSTYVVPRRALEEGKHDLRADHDDPRLGIVLREVLSPRSSRCCGGWTSSRSDAGPAASAGCCRPGHLHGVARHQEHQVRDVRQRPAPFVQCL